MKNVRRRIVREKVVQALYALEISGDPVDHVINHSLSSLKNKPEAQRFAEDLVRKTVEHREELDGMISARVTNWDLSRIAVLDRLILRMGICELLYFKEIPPKVSMDEAIELAKLFSTERSGQFVNGILDAVFEDLKNTGHLEKEGRGLWGDGSQKRKEPNSA
jgi:N utilization substance protein B